MWRLECATDSDGNPALRTLNGHQGRQVWVYRPDAGTNQVTASSAAGWRVPWLRLFIGP